MIYNKPQRKTVRRYTPIRQINIDYSGKLIPNTSYLIPDTLSVVSVKSVFH